MPIQYTDSFKEMMLEQLSGGNTSVIQLEVIVPENAKPGDTIWVAVSVKLNPDGDLDIIHISGKSPE